MHDALSTKEKKTFRQSKIEEIFWNREKVNISLVLSADLEFFFWPVYILQGWPDS